MKILFLDVDGVLNSEESFGINYQTRCEMEHAGTLTPENKLQYIYPLGHLYPPLIERLNKIVETTGCKIVLSSAWRKHWELPEFCDILEKKGFKFREALISKTGNDRNGIRGKEIQEWLNTAFSPEDNYVYAILDDDSEDIVGNKAGPWTHHNSFVKTDNMWGLQDEQMNKVIAILGKI